MKISQVAASTRIVLHDILPVPPGRLVGGWLGAELSGLSGEGTGGTPNSQISHRAKLHPVTKCWQDGHVRG